MGQIADLEPGPLFLANLGDFCGPGDLARHDHCLRLVEPLPVPDLCIVGNHDLDDADGVELVCCAAARYRFGTNSA